MRKLLILVFLCCLVSCAQKHFDNALQEKDVSYCEKISNKDKRSGCILALATQEQDVKICDSMGSDDIGPCYTFIAMMLKDEYLCGDLESIRHREACIDGAYIAQSLDDGYLHRCKYAHTDKTKGICMMAALKKNPSESECRKMERDASMCLTILAMVQKDSNICSQIGDFTYSMACQQLT